jgi:hypothetical protein
MRTQFGEGNFRKASTELEGDWRLFGWILEKQIVRLEGEWNWLRIVSSGGFW